jgi:hypothetical protein
MVARKSADLKVVKFAFVDISGSTMPVYLHDSSSTSAKRIATPKPGQVLRAHFDLKRGGESAPRP